MTGIGKYITFGLIFTAMSMGILLAITIGERNTIAESLKNANAIIKEKQRAVEETQKNLESKNFELSGCLGKIEELNQQASEFQLAQAEKDSQAGKAADERLAALPSILAADRAQGVTPEKTTEWFRSLFK